MHLQSLSARLTALGAFGVVLTSALYGAAPPRAALPMASFDLAGAMAATVQGARWMQAAGAIGVLSDMVLVVGTMLVALDLWRVGAVGQAAGWLGLTTATLAFIPVDVLATAVLPTSVHGSPEVWAAMRRLFDAFWLLGSAAFAVSIWVVSGGLSARALVWLARLSGSTVLLAVSAILLGVDAALPMGLGLASGCAAVGLQCLRPTTTPSARPVPCA